MNMCVIQVQVCDKCSYFEFNWRKDVVDLLVHMGGVQIIIDTFIKQSGCF